MSLDADHIVERRRLRRRVSLWRAAAFVMLFVALLALIGLREGSLIGGSGEHVARATLSGIIVGDRDRIEMFEEIAEDPSVKALILTIDSPGGTTAGSEALYDAIRKVADSGKPVVAQMETLAASGGYAVALAADHIIARQTTITGSIGVVFQWANIEQALDYLGVEVSSIKSGPLKAEPSPFEPASEEARAVIRSMILDSYDWFVDLVAERRDLSPAAARRLADGRVYTGRQAYEAGLIDALGGPDAARQWLASEHGIDPAMRERDWEPRTRFGALGASAGAWLARALGFDGVAAALQRAAGPWSGGLDGLVAVWQPQPIEE